ncbi:protein-glutamine glutaminase family protein [Bdellovibrio reynosensis]|uniref:Protein glutaminase domain-containing protein n=1 Tax=Bdellovibrio reynosensis TaxID=2835041 RepID=A0ABY4CH63_9BACT|nr:protein-glutamine glutaminase family protein [Bdellovibrio reynosensis]UOF01555.1 hypothetical protein MNR06_01130 [Bdellovibrio reynosensis]
MKFGLILGVLLFSVSSLAEDKTLHSFASGLDGTLRHLNRSEARPCPEDTILSPRTAKASKFDNKPVTALSEEDAQRLFTDLKNQSHIPYEFAWAGCQARAHEMSRLMLLKGVTPLKAFAFVDEKSPHLRVPHPSRKGEIISWNNHVAPMILVEKDGKQIPYVLDPSIENKAVSVEDWKKTMSQFPPAPKIQMEYGPATQLVHQTRHRIDFKDPKVQEQIDSSLREYKELATDPEKESQWFFEMNKYGE